ncbi:MAG TPA: hypothetical protein VJ762_14395 [Sphingobium sp.]|nr:hypothetical protein [Sphingobium sp.]
MSRYFRQVHEAACDPSAANAVHLSKIDAMASLSGAFPEWT